MLQYAQGELFEILEDDKSLPESEIRRIAQQLVYALNYLHQNRIIHRDMKVARPFCLSQFTAAEHPHQQQRRGEALRLRVRACDVF